jgi:hypothetical protein
MIIELLCTAVVGCSIPAAYLGACRKKVRRELARKGCRALKIHWTPWAESSVNSSHETRFEVRFLDSQGRSRAAICKVAPFSGVYWEDRP